MIKFVRYTIYPHSSTWFHSPLWKGKGNWCRNVSHTCFWDRYRRRAGQPSYWPIFSCRWWQSKVFGKVNSAQFSSFPKWRITKTMKVAITRFNYAKPAFVMVIYSFMCGKESINILRIVLTIQFQHGLKINKFSCFSVTRVGIFSLDPGLRTNCCLIVKQSGSCEKWLMHDIRTINP